MASAFGVQLKKAEGQASLGSDKRRVLTPGGVQLKKTDGQASSGSDKSGVLTPGGARRTEYKLKPLSDLKAMFDKTDEKVEGSQKSAKTMTADKSSPAKTAPATTKTEPPSKLTTKDKEDFEMLRSKLNQTGIEKLIEEDQPSVAVAKTYAASGQTYKATVDNKLAQSEGTKSSAVSKLDAVSKLSVGLTKLRTRPEVSKGDDEQVSLEDDSKKKSGVSRLPSGGLTASPKKDTHDTKYKPGRAKGWKSKTEVGQEKDLDNKTGIFSESAVGKIREDAKAELKAKGYRSVSPVNFSINSSDESSSSSNLSPRGYKANTGNMKYKVEALKTDFNENIRKFENSKSDSNLLRHGNKSNTAAPNIQKTESGTKQSALKQIAEDRDRICSNKDSGSFSSDSEKGKKSSKPKDGIKRTNKGRISREEFKQANKGKSDGQGHRPLSKASSAGSDSSLKCYENQPKSHTGEDLKSVSNKSAGSKKGNENLIKREVGTSRKLGTLKFRDIQKGFETKTAYTDTRSESPSSSKELHVIKEKNKFIERRQSFEGGEVFRSHSPSACKKTVEIEKHKFLERKESFEGGEIFRKKSYENKEVISPRDKGNVLHAIKAFTELDAKAKAKPSIVRRTQSLPVQCLGDYSSLEDIGKGPFYDDIEGTRVIDDVSNEGDISSEADLYEEIPASMTEKFESSREFKRRRATAFKNRKKLLDDQENTGEQAGSEGDIDSDTDSSNSGIYEPVDHDDDDNISESDSLSEQPPELPPARTGQPKKKKDKVEKGKGIRGKFKKLYKGKSMDNESALKAVTAPGLAASPQSASLMDRFKKNIKKQKSATSFESLNKEDNPVCESEGTDTDFDKNSPRSMEGQGQDLAPPPLPPRRSSTSDVTRLNNVEVSSRKSTNTECLNNAVSSSSTEPPLPPRNRISNNLDLNVVVPVHPGGDKRKSRWPPGKDSYLHEQKINNTSTADFPYMDQSPSPKSPTPTPSDAPPLPQRPSHGKRATTVSSSSTDSYVDVGDKSLSLKSQDSYVDVDAPLPHTDYSLAEEIRGPGGAGRKELEKRPVSSGYIKAYDLATVPEPKTMQAPFEDVIKFCSQYDEDGTYMDLSEDQVYGILGDRYKSRFEMESLYQFYNKEKINRASKRRAIYSSFDESDEEGYFEGEGDKESVYEDLSTYSSGRGSLDMDRKPEEEAKARQISTLEMFGKKGTVLRALWAEMPEVKDSGLLNSISPHERKLQESMFEIITSEATYLKSLNVLIDVFLRSEEFGSDMSNKCVLTKPERHVVFSNIGAIRDASERFLSDLEAQWKKSVMLSEKICEIINGHASENFECYIHYCSNQAFQDKAITDLKKKQDFSEALRRLEGHPDCQGLPMISFLLLPMQRITRLPLLVDAICHRMDPLKDKARHKAAVNAFNALSKVVKRCNEGAKKMQQTEQMYHIDRQIDFPANKEIPQIPLVSSSRCLVKQGEVTRILSDTATRLPFGKAKPSKQSLHIYLFNDILLVTKKKGERYVVTDYGQRNTLHAEMIDNPEKNPRVLPLGVPSGCKYLFLLVMLENYEKKQVEMVFSCSTLSDRARWVDAVTPVKVTDNQRIYEEWDCPQVQCIKKYTAQEPDELALEESDVVNVFKKLEDGMYEGERLRDGERGWFPKDHTVEIVNSHVRARNLRMKYRLMQASGEYA